ncbi:VOC family protein [Shimia sp.]|uniref:VOC family protein n=1 Tax=Shimia sp. TaxID=1954381 RepID=UPI003BA9E9BB
MPPLGRLVIYTKKIDALVDFYCSHFGYQHLRIEGDRIVELRAPDGGASLLLHPASKGQKAGQSLIKLVFDVQDVPAFCEKAKERGLDFGPIHQADGYCFATAKDPSGNSVSVSSRAFVVSP